jgi:glycosyltransferase involved in cell wall biosynthesis
MKDAGALRVAIVHDWIWSMAGGERVAEAALAEFPQADVFALIVNHRAVSGPLAQKQIRTSFLQRVPGGVRHYRWFLPLFPIAAEQFDLRGYDLVISSDSACVKGLLKSPRTLHVCYCHTPMRYAWDLYLDYLEAARPGLIRGSFMRLFLHYIRMYDFGAAQRVDRFVANSRFVARRIRNTYRRDAHVIHPPVRTGYFVPDPNARSPGAFDLIVSRLVSYKRVDLAVEAYRGLARDLVVIGDGPDERRLRRSAPPNVRFKGAVADGEVLRHMQTCRAFLLPGVEDFGISAVEAQSCGRPVVAFRDGGACETVVDGETGLFFDRQTPEDLRAAVERSCRVEWDAARIRGHALAFSEDRFRRELRDAVARWMDEHRAETSQA